jgi:predicted MFS family arabinose efflux permease
VVAERKGGDFVGILTIANAIMLIGGLLIGIYAFFTFAVKHKVSDNKFTQNFAEFMFSLTGMGSSLSVLFIAYYVDTEGLKEISGLFFIVGLVASFCFLQLRRARKAKEKA